MQRNTLYELSKPFPVLRERFLLKAKSAFLLTPSSAFRVYQGAYAFLYCLATAPRGLGHKSVQLCSKERCFASPSYACRLYQGAYAFLYSLINSFSIKNARATSSGFSLSKSTRAFIFSISSSVIFPAKLLSTFSRSGNFFNVS